MKTKYYLAKETITNSEIDNLIEWLQTYPRLTKDKLTVELEKDWAQFIGTKYSVFCNSGSSANLLMIYAALRANKLRNKKVVVPSVGWVTTVAPFIQFGCEPIMLDVDEDTFGIDLEQLENVCRNDNVGAVMFVQVLGVPHYKEELLRLKEKYGFYLFEDGCAALGAEYEDGSKVGTVGDCSSFSFYFGHQLSTIEGGMVNTNDKELYNMMMMIRSHGWGKDLEQDVYEQLLKKYDIDDFHKPFTFFEAGMNLRSTDLQAFLGIEQIKKADWVVERRYQNHLHYAGRLDSKFKYQNWGSNKPVSISFGCLATSTQHRKNIITNLVKNGVETRIFSAGNLGKHPFWIEEYGEFGGVVADKIHSSGFFLPNYPELEEKDIDFICDVVNSSEV